MSSFTRTIPSENGEAFVNQILSREDHYVPLAYRPTRAQPGDFIYLVFRGRMVGRARIAAIESAAPARLVGEDRYPPWAKWIIRFVGTWQKPPRDIPVQGHQSVRYLETHALEHLDTESW
ncbi:MAG TPA: hypothetical protein G4O08_01400 [Anaerolineae bacterium]|nr:hypothetical protein [Anaerolineae bacterium]